MKLSRKQRYNLGRDLESRFRSAVDKPGMHEILITSFQFYICLLLLIQSLFGVRLTVRTLSQVFNDKTTSDWPTNHICSFVRLRTYSLKTFPRQQNKQSIKLKVNQQKKLPQRERVSKLLVTKTKPNQREMIKPKVKQNKHQKTSKQMIKLVRIFFFEIF